MEQKPEGRLQHFSISFFAIILGLSGFSIALQKMEEIYNITFKASTISLYLTMALFTLFIVIKIKKIIRHPEHVKEEFNHPIKLNFFPTISISLILFSVAYFAIDKDISKYLLVVGLISHLIFTLKVMSIWTVNNNLEMKHLNPAWFIPIVGNILVPVTGVALLPIDISWFFFTIGLLYWLILFAIIMNRIIFHKTLPEKLRPTLFILIAPPAIGFIAYVKLNGGEVDNFARILYFTALFLTVNLFFQFKFFKQIKQFYLSWWAYSFPLSSITLASILMYHTSNLIIYKYFALVFFIILVLVIILLFVKTVEAIKKRGLCVEEED